MKAVFFDFDGVLTTDATGTETTCRFLHEETRIDVELLLSAYKKHGLDLLLGKKTHAELWDDFCHDVGIKIDFSLLKEAFLSTPKNEKLFAIVNRAKKKYKVGIITDNSKERFETLVEAWNLEEAFDALILSAATGTLKNEEEIFKEALAALDVKPKETVFIDNKEQNLIVPKRMGFKTIHHDPSKNDIDLLLKNLRAAGIDL